MKPLISILIPCYNGAKFLKFCLDSCLAQTYSNIEVIVINDGSTDNSLEILNEYKAKNPNFNLQIFSQANVGVSETRNRLVSYANGQYFLFLDADDVLSNDAVNDLYEGSNNGTYNLVVGRSSWLINSKIKLPFLPTWWKVKNMSVNHYIKSNICTPWASIIKTDYFRSLEIQFIKNEIFEDIGIMPFVYIKAEKSFNFIKKTVYHYRLKNREEQHLSNFGKNIQQKIFSLYQQTNKILELMEQENFNSLKKYKRYINGINYQILTAFLLLSSKLSFTKFFHDREFKITARFNILKILKNYGYYSIKISKTFWKFPLFFYIKFWYFNASRAIKKDINNNLTKFLNTKIIKKRNKYTLSQSLKFNPKKPHEIIIINENNLKDFLKQLNKATVVKNKVLLDFSTEYFLNDFLDQNYALIAQKNIMLGIKSDNFYDWKRILKYFSFIYSDNLDLLKFVKEQDLKIITMSAQIDDENLVNYIVGKNENI